MKLYIAAWLKHLPDNYARFLLSLKIIQFLSRTLVGWKMPNYLLELPYSSFFFPLISVN